MLSLEFPRALKKDGKSYLYLTPFTLRFAQLAIPAIALLGIHLSGLQQKLLAKKNRIILMLDGDHAGRKAAERLQPVLNCFTHTHRITLPDGLDPDDLSDAELVADVAPFFS